MALINDIYMLRQEDALFRVFLTKKVQSPASGDHVRGKWKARSNDMSETDRYNDISETDHQVVSGAQVLQ